MSFTLPWTGLLIGRIQNTALYCIEIKSKQHNVSEIKCHLEAELLFWVIDCKCCNCSSTKNVTPNIYILFFDSMIHSDWLIVSVPFSIHREGKVYELVILSIAKVHRKFLNFEFECHLESLAGEQISVVKLKEGNKDIYRHIHINVCVFKNYSRLRHLPYVCLLPLSSWPQFFPHELGCLPFCISGCSSLGCVLLLL